MKLHINEQTLEQTSEKDFYDLSVKELAFGIRDMINKLNFKKVDLDKNFVNGKGKELYYTLHDIMWKAVGSYGGTMIREETNYPVEFDNFKALYSVNSRGTQKFVFLDSGYMWTITKNGNVKMDRAVMKIDTLRFLYKNLENCF